MNSEYMIGNDGPARYKSNEESSNDAIDAWWMMNESVGREAIESNWRIMALSVQRAYVQCNYDEMMVDRLELMKADMWIVWVCRSQTYMVMMGWMSVRDNMGYTIDEYNNDN